jgi:protein ImuA
MHRDPGNDLHNPHHKHPDDTPGGHARVLPLFATTEAAAGTKRRERCAAGETPAGSAAVPEALREIIRRRDTWLGLDLNSGRAANHDQHDHPHLATGFAALDAQLCEGGWPLGTCIEVLTDACGMGAMGLFLPAMQALSEQSRWQAFITPPYTPYAPLLAARDIDTQQVLLVHPKDREEQLWSTEQALRSGTCSAVFSWLGHGEYRYAELRRLQLAAARGDTLAVLFRPREAAHQHAPASLRLEMQAYRDVRILKQRSGLQGINVYLPPEDDIPHQPQLWELPADASGVDTRAAS